MPSTPPPRGSPEISGRSERQLLLLRGAHDGARQGMFAGPLHAGSKRKQSVLRECHAFKHLYACQIGLAFRKRAGLVEHQRVYTGEGFQRLGIPHKHAGRRSAAHGNHDGHGRGQSQRTGTRNDQYGNARDQRVSESRLWAEQSPADKGDDRRSRDRGNKVPGHFIRKTLHGSAAALGFADQLHDLRQQGFAADAFRDHDEAPAGVKCAGGDFIAHSFLDGKGFAGDHRFVNGAGTFANHAVNGDTFTGSYTERIAMLDLLEGHVLLSSSGYKVRGARRKVQ